MASCPWEQGQCDEREAATVLVTAASWARRAGGGWVAATDEAMQSVAVHLAGSRQRHENSTYFSELHLPFFMGMTTHMCAKLRGTQTPEHNGKRRTADVLWLLGQLSIP